MGTYNICYWSTPEKAWNELDVDQEYICGDYRVTVVDKKDNHIIIKYKSDGHTRRLSKNQALSWLKQ